MGSGHRSGRPEGRTAPPRGSRQPPRGWPGSSRPAAACGNRPVVPRRRRFHHPANEPARDEKTDPARSTSADSPTAAGQWCLQSGRARGGFAGPPCQPRIAQEPPRCATSSWDHWRDTGSGRKECATKHLFLGPHDPPLLGGSLSSQPFSRVRSARAVSKWITTAEGGR